MCWHEGTEHLSAGVGKIVIALSLAVVRAVEAAVV
jgi:hypothetical protein